MTSDTSLQKALELHKRLLVVDCHHDIAMDIAHRHLRGDNGVLSGEWADLLEQGGVKVQILPIFIEDIFLPGLGLREILRAAEALLSDLDADSSRMALATDMAGIDAVLASGRTAGVMALEGCDGLGGDPALLRLMYRLGVRMVAFTWERRNEFADGTGIGNPGGLTAAGRKALVEMFDHHVLCDVSHLAEPSFWDVMKLARGPIIASHSNARAVCEHPRNLTDAQIRALAESGGVIGLNFFGRYIHAETPTLEGLLAHMEHIADLVGLEHVGLGPDFLEKPLRDLAKVSLANGPFDTALLDNWIPDCQNINELPRFTALLVEKGYSEPEIAGVLGQNWMRVFRQVWGE
ncbi:MAG: membrane dipeptidase [Chloroflexi bacterium]|nr:membrane dipeptidase [Chloroflexota bacterium]